MYVSEHGHTGALITTASFASLGIIGIPIGLGLAFISHFLLDYIAEPSYKSWVKVQSYSFIVFLSCLIALLYFGKYLYLFTFLGGYIAGNLPDAIDKGIKVFFWIFKGRQRENMFSCHNGNSIFFRYKDKKLGYPTIFHPTTHEYNQIQFTLTVLILILTIIILK